MKITWGCPSGRNGSTFLVLIFRLQKNLLSGMESGISSGDAAIDRRLEQCFLDFFLLNAVIDGCPDVQGEFVAAVCVDKHRDRQPGVWFSPHDLGGYFFVPC